MDQVEDRKLQVRQYPKSFRVFAEQSLYVKASEDEQIDRHTSLTGQLL